MAKVRDPVCGMTVDSERAPASGIYPEGPVYFCSPGCKRTYESKRRA